MFINTKHKKELQQEVAELERQITYLKREKEDLSTTITHYKQLISRLSNDTKNASIDAVHACAPVVDLRFMKAFSVERFYKNEQIITVIGYFRPDNTVGEWFLHCSDEQHRTIANEFRKLVPMPI